MNTCNDHVTTMDEIEMDALPLEQPHLAICFDCWICFLKKKGYLQRLFENKDIFHLPWEWTGWNFETIPLFLVRKGTNLL